MTFSSNTLIYLPILLVILADEGGDIEAPEWLLLGYLGGAGAELLLPGRRVRGTGRGDAARAAQTLCL